MSVRVWALLNSKSRRCVERRYKRRRKPGKSQYYVYRPRGDLLVRLSQELGMSQTEVLGEIRALRVRVLRSLGHVVRDNERV
ncbi:MAG: hypothetical protein F6J87_27210 [Spirulina sp. SIO3F2]|nr:hypothetical protein [Spirulina sp. SIO3F2]